MRLLFEGGDYSRAASDQGNTVTVLSNPMHKQEYAAGIIATGKR